MKKIKINYAVNLERTSVVVANKSDKVSDILCKIQINEDDEEYKHRSK